MKHLGVEGYEELGKTRCCGLGKKGQHPVPKQPAGNYAGRLLWHRALSSHKDLQQYLSALPTLINLLLNDKGHDTIVVLITHKLIKQVNLKEH